MLNPQDYLRKILDKKEKEIVALKSQGISAFVDKVEDVSYSFKSFYDSLRGSSLSLIGELKKASPSKGLINPDFDIIKLSQRYEEKGASAFSILTEINYFLGDPGFISTVKKNRNLPILRKDFIIDSIQVYESKILGADAILLILDILSLEKAQELLNLAKDLNLEVLMEIHSEEALSKLSGLDGLRIVGVNNRDLNTFKVDLNLGLTRLDQLQKSLPSDVLFVAESGYTTAAELDQLEKAGFSAVLIGEGLVTHPGMISFFTKRL
ncbi:indole-3-glycerol phosphate synthase TrpC [Candidatus Marinamargulisbacteria bacterium SCGC AAA071-K20]|nr:indole-3-glycerol phosphate synthase TrpC [Candidatus Marinamargulisbacteria bacterium SCGC AAA071-K20]